jgi:vitellogenic carboxypeptidase-like protein
MLTFLHKFYENFPEKRKADLYLATESYGGIPHLFAKTGKYGPSIATAILDYNEKPHTNKIPLKGMSIGNQWTDPNSQILTHAAQAFYLGLVDEAQSQHLLALAHEAIAKNLVYNFGTLLILGRRYPGCTRMEIRNV